MAPCPALRHHLQERFAEAARRQPRAPRVPVEPQLAKERPPAKALQRERTRRVDAVAAHRRRPSRRT
jgi:hypothetical protein